MLSSKALIICAFFMVISTVLALETSSVSPSDVVLSDFSFIQDSIQNYYTKYYYIDLKANQKLSIEFYRTDGSGTQDIYMQELNKPTASSFEQKSSFEYHTKKMVGPVQTQAKRIWIGVKNVDGYSGTFNFRVRTLVVVSPSPSPSPKPTPNHPIHPTPPNPKPTPDPVDCNCENEARVVGYGIAPIVGLTLPSILISISLLIVVVVQFKKINEISKKIIELERKFQSNDQEIPIMNVPLLENVQNNESQEQAIPLPEYPIVYRLPYPMYPQTIQNQTNSQPMVFLPPQPLSNAQSKQ